MSTAKIKIIGYGNPSRLDDGLGPAMIEALEAENLQDVELETDFQLNIEDLVGLEQFEAIIFIDADVSCPPPFTFTEIIPEGEISFSSHTVSPASLLGLAESHFGITIPGYVLAIRGYDFDDFDEKLSAGARENLHQAKKHLMSFLAEHGCVRSPEINAGEVENASAATECEERI